MSASTAPPPVRTPATPAGSRPLKSRYLLVVLLPVVALASIVVWGMFSAGAVDEMSKGWERTDVPGQMVVDLHPGTWFVFQDATLSEPTIRVLGPGGAPVAVEPQQSSTDSGFGSSAGSLIARFEVPPGESAGGTYTVIADSADRQGSIAVTDVDVIGWQRIQQIAMWVLLLVNAGAALAIAVVPVVRWRRSTRPVVSTS